MNNGLNIVDGLRINAAKFPNKAGFIFEDTPYTYDHVLQRAEGLAVHLNRNGITNGCKVCTLFYNSIELVYAYFATLMLGAVLVPINFRFIESEIAYIVADSDAEALLHGPEFSETVDRVKEGLPDLKLTQELNAGSQEVSILFKPN